MSDFSTFLVYITEAALVLAVTTIPIMAFMFIRSRTRVPRDQVPPEEMDQIHARLAEVDALQGRLMEVEERLDFAERMLAQRNEAPQMPLHRTPV